MKKVSVVASIFVFILSALLSAVETGIVKAKTDTSEYGYVARVTKIITDGQKGEEGVFVSKKYNILVFKCPVCNKTHKTGENGWKGLIGTDYKDAELCIYKKDTCQYFKHKKPLLGIL